MGLYAELSGCFQKYRYPQIINFNRVFLYKPSILGYPYFWKHPSIISAHPLDGSTSTLRRSNPGTTAARVLEEVVVLVPVLDEETVLVVDKVVVWDVVLLDEV